MIEDGLFSATEKQERAVCKKEKVVEIDNSGVGINSANVRKPEVLWSTVLKKPASNRSSGRGREKSEGGVRYSCKNPI